MGSLIAVFMIVLGAGAVYVGITGSQGKVWDLITGQSSTTTPSGGSSGTSGGGGVVTHAKGIVGIGNPAKPGAGLGGHPKHGRSHLGTVGGAGRAG